VVVATNQIRIGTTLESADLQTVEIPASTAIVQSFVPSTELDSLVGQVATRSILANEPLLRSDFRPPATSSGLRAMSISLPPSNAVGGDLSIGDLVDVLVVGEESSRFVAEQVPVLDLPAQVSSGLAAPTNAWWVTLGVEETEALEIANGVERGSIYLVRSNGARPLSVHQLPMEASVSVEASP
jgi:Flp pilus assembly protein CpaB